MKTYFVTYGDNNFRISKNHLIYLAKQSGFFNDSFSFGPKDLSAEFKKKYSEVLNNKRGGGYWIWKHEIIFNLLKNVNDGDVVVYCDAGASININASKRFYEYIEILKSSKHFNLRMEAEKQFLEKFYTIKNIFDYFHINLDSEIANSTQLQAGHMFFEKSKETIDYFLEFKKVLDHDPNCITDIYNQEQKLEGFVENRHDQSIFSILSKYIGSEIIPNETEFRMNKSEQYKYPFLSVRVYKHGLKDKFKYYILRDKKYKDTIYF